MLSTHLNSSGRGENIGLVNTISDMAEIAETDTYFGEGTSHYWSWTRHSAPLIKILEKKQRINVQLLTTQEKVTI